MDVLIASSHHNPFGVHAMKPNLKALAAAVLLACSAGAQAIIQPGNNPELIFVAYESNTLLTYTFDTGTAISELVSPIESAFGLFALTGFDSFLSQVGSANLSNIRWGVFAGVGQSPNVGFRRLYTTQNGTGGSNPSSSRIAFIDGSIDAHIRTVTPGSEHERQEDGWSIYQSQVERAPADPGYGGWLLGPNGNFNDNLSFNVTGNLSESLNFMRFQNATPLTSQRIQFASISGGATTWSVVGGNILVFTSPIPEPSTYALMLAGLVAVGVATRRRRSA